MFCSFLLHWGSDCCLFGDERDNSLPCASLFTDFSESKSGKILFVWLSVVYLGLKRITHFNLQLYSPTFRNRKSRALKSVNKRFSPLKRRSESAALFSTQNCIVGKSFITSEICNLRSQTLRAARWGWFPNAI